MWTDSTMLHSIEKKHVFVANRDSEVPKLTTVHEWNLVPAADDHPADAGTCGLPAKPLLDNSCLK